MIKPISRNCRASFAKTGRPLASSGAGLALLAMLVLGAGGCGGPEKTPNAAPASPPPSRLDVVLVTIDTMRADAPGFDGNAAGTTPLLDRFAATGRVFVDTHAHSVVTLPSHTNILTGLYPYQHGVRENEGFKLAANVPTLATLLHDAGYATGAFVSAFPLDSRFGLNRGFDVYDDSYPLESNPEAFQMSERRGDVTVAAALKWWASARGKPRFLWVHLYDPHSPYRPPEPFLSRFRQQPYLGEVAAADSFLEPLLAPFLSGHEAPALIVVTADHGEALGEHGELTHGIFAYEATLKVPLLLWGDGVSVGRDDRAAFHVDIVPTVLQRLGLTAPETLPGHSLLAPPESRSAYFEALSTCLNRGWAPLRGALREQRKFIELPLPELYDLASDPHEQHNLFADDRRAAGELRQSLPAENPWPPRQGKSTTEEQNRLRSLGYVTGGAAPRAVYTAADDPKTLIEVDALLQTYVERYGRGDFAGAAAAARAAIARHADSESYTNLSLALRQMERTAEATAVLKEALARGFDTEQIRRALGLTLSEAGHPEAAVAVLKPLAGSDDPTSVNALAIALTDAGQLADAEALLRAQAVRTPRDPKTRENLAIAVLRAGRAAEARDLLRALLAQQDSLPVSWNTLGVALYQTGDPNGALAAWGRAAQLDARQFDALFNIGLVATEAGQPGLARQALMRFVSTAPPARYAADIARARQLLTKLPQ